MHNHGSSTFIEALAHLDAMDAIVSLSLLFVLVLLAAWAYSPKVRAWIESPKYRFQANVRSYDKMRAHPSEARDRHAG